MVLLVLIGTIGILAYAGFLLDPSHRGDLLPYAMVITAETILVAQALLAMWTILSGSSDPRDYVYHDAAARLMPGAGATAMTRCTWRAHLSSSTS